MKSDRPARTTRNPSKRLKNIFLVVCMAMLPVFPAYAQDYTELRVGEPPQSTGSVNAPLVSSNQPPQVAPSTTIPAAPPKPPELARVEGAMGQNLGRDWDAYMYITQGRSNPRFGFADYLHNRYQSNRTVGIVLAGVVAPMIAGLAALGAYGIYRHGAEDNGGFCNHVTYDEIADEYDTDCEGDRAEVSGIVLLSSIGGIAAIAVLIPGLVKIGIYGGRLRQIAPLVARADARAPRVQFSYAVNPMGAAVGLRF